MIQPRNMARSANATWVFNEDGIDNDFRIESDTNENMLFVDASTDRVGIGTATPTVAFDVTGAIKASGAITAGTAFGLTTGDFTITAGNLIFGAASAKILPGATSLLFRNNADSSTNLGITDAGAVTVRAGLTITGSGLTVTSGTVTVTSGNLQFTAASSKIIAGATSLLIRDTADANTNVTITDAGAMTVRAGLTVTAGGLTVTAGRTAIGAQLNLAAVGTALAVGSNTITPTKSYHLVDSSGGAVTVKTITAGTDGDLLILQPNHATNDVVFDNTGNLRVGNAGSRTLTNQQDSITFVYSTTLTKWVETGFATNA